MTRVLTPELLAATMRGLQKLFLKYYEAADIGAWAQLFNRTTSNSAGETYPLLGAAPMLAPFTGTRQYSGLRTDGFYVLNEAFDAGIQVARADIERDSLGKYDGAVQEMAQNAKAYVVELLAAILANGTSTTLAKCWDGKSLFSTTHGKDKGAGQSNIITGSGVDTVDHVQTDIAQGLARMGTFKNDKGVYTRGITPNIAIYPAANYGLGKILDTIRANRTAEGTPNQSMIIQEVMPVPDITGDDWFLAAGGGGLRPFGYQVEKDATPETTYDHDTLTVKMSVELRAAGYCADWRRIVKVDNT